MKNNAMTGATLTIIVVGLVYLIINLVGVFHQPSERLVDTVDANINTAIDPTPSVEAKLISTHTVEYIERPVTEVKYVEQVKYVDKELKQFTSLDELNQWLDDNQDANTIRFQSQETEIDCDDYALELQMKALASGYVMSFQIIETDRYNSLFETASLPPHTMHAINLVTIGNAAYYIEPQTNEVVIAAYLD